MNRPCLALTILMVSLGGSLLVVGSAFCQHCPGPHAWNHDLYPFADTDPYFSPAPVPHMYARVEAEAVPATADGFFPWENLHPLENKVTQFRGLIASYREAYTRYFFAPGDSDRVPWKPRRTTADEPVPTTDAEPYRSGYDRQYDRIIYGQEQRSEQPSSVAVEEVHPFEGYSYPEEDYWFEGEGDAAEYGAAPAATNHRLPATANHDADDDQNVDGDDEPSYGYHDYYGYDRYDGYNYESSRGGQVDDDCWQFHFQSTPRVRAVPAQQQQIQAIIDAASDWWLSGPSSKLAVAAEHWQAVAEDHWTQWACQNGWYAYYDHYSAVASDWLLDSLYLYKWRQAMAANAAAHPARDAGLAASDTTQIRRQALVFVARSLDEIGSSFQWASRQVSRLANSDVARRTPSSTR